MNNLTTIAALPRSLTKVSLRLDPISGDMHFSGIVKSVDVMRLNLDHVDRKVLADCERPGATAADILLALELLFRRIKEWYDDGL